MKISPTTQEDIPALQHVLDKTELFPSDMLPDMVAGFLGQNDAADIWLTYRVDDVAIGFCYTAPEMLTDRTWNMRAIAVLPEHQGKGVGTALTQALEEQLKQDDQSTLIVDTSSTDDFAPTRQFYENNGYTAEARIRDFWGPGDDKIIFWKSFA